MTASSIIKILSLVILQKLSNPSDLDRLDRVLHSSPENSLFPLDRCLLRPLVAFRPSCTVNSLGPVRGMPSGSSCTSCSRPHCLRLRLGPPSSLPVGESNRTSLVVVFPQFLPSSYSTLIALKGASHTSFRYCASSAVDWWALPPPQTVPWSPHVSLITATGCRPLNTINPNIFGSTLWVSTAPLN